MLQVGGKKYYHQLFLTIMYCSEKLSSKPKPKLTKLLSISSNPFLHPNHPPSSLQ